MVSAAARLLALSALALAVAAPAQAHTQSKPPKKVQGIHAFLLRADEAPGHLFSRTPSFAWTPTKGAASYELTLSTSRLASGNALVWEDATLKSPIASVPIALPWITGSPYSLYARVRATGPDGRVGAWSDPYGFNMRWPSVPAPLASIPGLIRWTPIDGATSYQVWLTNTDVNDRSKTFTTTTNVADEREYYTFHQRAPFTSSVQWRIRAIRQIYGSRLNGLPAVTYGPWSPTYTDTNPPDITHGPLTAVGTISDGVTTSTEPSSSALMPGFVISGDNASGHYVELYQVEAFTDSDCINPVFEGSIVGSPAYAPRLQSPLSMPTSLTALNAARTSFLGDGPQDLKAVDGRPVVPNEQLPPATFAPAGSTTTGTGTGTGTASTTTASGAAPSATTGAAVPTINGPGAPVDLWDTNWPEGHYWWTVMPIDAQVAATINTTLASTALKGATTLRLASGSGVGAGDTLLIGSSEEPVTVLSVDADTVTLTSALGTTYVVGETVVRRGGAIEYWQAELPQEACAAGRLQSFGIGSTPTLAAAGTPHVSGLSPNGRLVAALKKKPSFYGNPLAAWAPAMGATFYEVQWSKTRYPWRAANSPYYTYATSAVLPLKPGAWWYRVRGIDTSAPTGAQMMTWSDPVGIVVARPRFKVVGRSAATSMNHR